MSRIHGTPTKWAVSATDIFNMRPHGLKRPGRASLRISDKAWIREFMKKSLPSAWHITASQTTLPLSSLLPFVFSVAPTSESERSKHSSIFRVKHPDTQARRVCLRSLRGKLMREECNSCSWSPARGPATAMPLFALGRSSLETFYEIPEAARSSVLWPSRFVCKYSLWMRMFGPLDKNKADDQGTIK